MQDVPIGFRPNRAAQKLGVSRSSIWRMCNRGQLQAIHLSPRLTLITTKSIDALIARLEAAAAHE